MKQIQALTTLRVFFLFLLGTALAFTLTAMQGGGGAASASHEVSLADLGVQACVPRPSIEPPPPVEGSAFGAEYEMAGLRPLPCPDGFVPQPVERRVPRGRPSLATPSSQKTAGAVAAPTTGAKYYYAGAYQWAAGTGASAFLTQHLPWLMPEDYHSLAEISVQSADVRQIVEVGWTVDRAVNSDDNPHLFVYHWVNGAGTCYNGCGWVQFSGSRFPGMGLAYDGSASQYMIQYRDGNWWIGYQGEWIGYFPGSLWNGVYTASGLVQWFGELAAGQATAPPHSSIGNYYSGASGDPNSARMSQLSVFDSAGGAQQATPALYITNSALYDAAAGSEPNEFLYGGHGGAP
jgi:hypothetical protein